MKVSFSKIWKDPVVSAVIAAGVIALLALCSQFFINIDYAYYLSIFSESLIVPIWMVFITVCAFILLLFILNKRQPEELSDNDIKILISNWWPKKGMFDGGITVEHSVVDRKLKLPLGSTQKHIDDVAISKFYKVVNKGSRFTEYRTDMDKIINTHK